MKKKITLLSLLSFLLLTTCNSDNLVISDFTSDNEQFAGIEATDINTENIRVLANTVANTVRDVRQGKVQLSEKEMENVRALILKYGMFDLVEVAYPDEELEIVTHKSGMKARKKDNFYIIGDMLLTEEQMDDFYGDGESDYNLEEVQLRGSISTKSSHKWPNNTVYYEFAPNMTWDTKVYALQAMSHWAQYTNIDYLYRAPSNKDYVYFFNGSGCYSSVGRQGGKQDISLDASWAFTGIAIHEFGHAIGLHHEHCKQSRDQYIIVNLQNVKSDKRHNYDRVTSNYTMTSGFDYESIMLYDSYMWDPEFVYNPPQLVLTRINGSTWEAQRIATSVADRITVNYIYY
jgi:hypothetical protein